MSSSLRPAIATSPRRSTTAAAQRAASATPASGPIHDRVAQLAYLKWKVRGCRSDTAVQDWLEAEAEVKSEIRRERRS
jgi:hypothetical protein